MSEPAAPADDPVTSEDEIGFHSSLWGNCTINSNGTVRDESGRVVAAEGVIDGTIGLRGDMSGLYR